MQVVAQDDDLGLYGQVEYSMGADGAGYFTINEITGEVTTLVDFDREVPVVDAIIVSGQVIDTTFLHFNEPLSLIKKMSEINVRCWHPMRKLLSSFYHLEPYDSFCKVRSFFELKLVSDQDNYYAELCWPICELISYISNLRFWLNFEWKSSIFQSFEK